ncbi:translocation/assembly module TamB domain-containing protein [Noviherbaspirillum galbum]|uniref:DUF490 domain-containing protein n=1 Tax=Noviherbaspirillum galbum TaxID=2709383 RepID=A0A6B3SK07_9BURK|nr:translocation/assembly module TamB domain-containing protein [Noviherbaspirillum galbum]NEX59685.1 DUF490 domain-containing protein [Noviherbaspirillum galbum]
MDSERGQSVRDTSTAPSGKPVRRHSRTAATVIAILLLLLLLLALAGYWLVGTSSGARFVLRQAAPGVQAEGVEGSLLGPLKLAQLSIVQPDRRVVLKDVRLDWDPAALLQRRLHVRSAGAARIDIVNQPDAIPKPPSLPDRIGLPLQLQIDALNVGQGVVSRGPVPLATFGPLAAALSFDGRQYRLRLDKAQAGSPEAQSGARALLQGDADLGVEKPYALRGRFVADVSGKLDDQLIQGNGELVLGGSLAVASAGLQFRSGEAVINGSALLHPFSMQPLANADVVADKLDLREFNPRLPHTVLHLDLKSGADSTGTLRVQNQEAGPLGKQLLPLRALSLAFAQKKDGVDIDDIIAEPGTATAAAGRIEGKGRVAPAEASLHLDIRGLNLKLLDPAWRRTALSGSADLRQAGSRRKVDLSLREPDGVAPGGQPLELAASAELAGQEVRVTAATVRTGTSRLDASGTLSFAGEQPFQLQGKMQAFRLQDLGKFAQWPELTLNGEIGLRGKRAPRLEADLKLDIADSRLAGQPLAGQGQVRLRGDKLEIPVLRLASGLNRLDASGSLTESGGEVQFQLAANQLAQLGPAFGGSLQASGTARGTLDLPRIDATWTASQLKLPGGVRADSMQGKADVQVDRRQPVPLREGNVTLDASRVAWAEYRLNTASVQARIGTAADAPLSLALRMEGIETPQLRANKLDADANGTTGRHVVNLRLEEARQVWMATANGGLSNAASAPRWEGEISRFDSDGRFKSHLAAPASLALDARNLRLERFVLETPAGRVAVDEFRRDPDGVSSKGHADNIQVAELIRQLQPSAPVRTDLQLAADWDFRMQDTVDGRLSVRRERGDMTIVAGSPVALGIGTLAASARAENGRLELELEAEGSRLGKIQVSGRGATGRGAEKLLIPADAPVSATARIDVPSIAWAASLLSPAWTLEGRLRGDVALAGTRADPQLSGKVEGADLRVAMSNLGLDLRQGVLQGEFRDNLLQLKQLTFRGGDGEVALSGPIELGTALSAKLQLDAKRFTAVNRSDRRIVVSGGTAIVLAEKRLTVNGGFRVDEGFVDLGLPDRPRLSEDVVIDGQPRRQPTAVPAALDVNVDLGKGVKVTGRGLDGLVVGAVHVTNDPGGSLQGTGTFNIAEGSFSAYGRTLKIEQGVLRFAGPIGNPSLDILAMRRGQEVEAGVSVRGNVLAPRVTLVSEPTVPDAEKLSWLVLGRGLSSAGEGDISALQSAAGTLLSKGAAAGVESRLASAFGLDTFSVGKSADNLQQRIITIGKQINSRLYVSYQQGLENAGSVLQLRFTLTPRLSLEAEAGSRSAISLFYNIAFD